jgi:hypothetical protein
MFRQMKSFQLPGKEDPAVLAHVDFTDTSAPRVLKQHLGSEATELSQKPWAIIQVSAHMHTNSSFYPHRLLLQLGKIKTKHVHV